MDFINFINTQAPVSGWSTEQKQELLDDLCKYFDYDGYVLSTQSPDTKKQFINGKIKAELKQWVNAARRVAAIEAISYTEVDLD